MTKQYVSRVTASAASTSSISIPAAFYSPPTSVGLSHLFPLLQATSGEWAVISWGRNSGPALLFMPQDPGEILFHLDPLPVKPPGWQKVGKHPRPSRQVPWDWLSLWSMRKDTPPIFSPASVCLCLSGDLVLSSLRKGPHQAVYESFYLSWLFFFCLPTHSQWTRIPDLFINSEWERKGWTHSRERRLRWRELTSGREMKGNCHLLP